MKRSMNGIIFFIFIALSYSIKTYLIESSGLSFFHERYGAIKELLNIILFFFNSSIPAKGSIFRRIKELFQFFNGFAAENQSILHATDSSRSCH